MRHFLKENDFDPGEIYEIFRSAARFKANRGMRPTNDLSGQSWGMIFFKRSTRTRVSFEVGIRELGGHPLMLDQSSTQLGRGESVKDTAKVLSRFLDGIIIRANGHDLLEEFARFSSIPVVNALTDLLHPCQIYADCMTLMEKLGLSSDPFSALAGKRLAFYGDTCSNMANSWILAGALFGMEISLCGPKEYAPGNVIREILSNHGLSPSWSFTSDPREGARMADAVYTDVWVSMGCENESEERLRAMKDFQVDQSVLDSAKDHCLFMHCMPAHPGEEVHASVLESNGPDLFDQAENRLHMQKAVLCALSQFNSVTP